MKEVPVGISKLLTAGPITPALMATWPPPWDACARSLASGFILIHPCEECASTNFRQNSPHLF